MNDQANQSNAIAPRRPRRLTAGVALPALGAAAVFAAIAVAAVPGRADADGPSGTDTAASRAPDQTTTPTPAPAISSAPSSQWAHAVTGGS